MPGAGSNPNWPDLRVYVDFTNPGANSTYTWTDITAYCRRLGNGQLIHMERGRNYERAQTDAGTCTFVLDNSTGAFDPANSASPFYPNVKPIRKVQVRATSAGPNMLSTFDASFESGSGTWFFNTLLGGRTLGTSVGTTTARATNGASSLLVTWSTSASGNFVGPNAFTTVIGQTYTFSADVFVPSGSPDVRALAAFIVGGPMMSKKDQWVRVSVTFVATATSTQVGIDQLGSTNGQTCYVDNAYLSTPTTYNLFTGRVEDWPRVWKSSGYWGEVTATARGPLSSLSTVALFAPWVEAAIIDGATAIYRCNDPAGSVSCANSSSFQQLRAPIKFGSATTTKSTFTYGSEPGAGNLAGDPSNSLSLSPETLSSTAIDTGYYLQTASASDGSANLFLPATGGWSWEAWFLSGSPVPPSTPRVLLAQSAPVGGNCINFWIDNGSASNIQVSVIGAVNYATLWPNIVLDDGAWHHIVVTLDTDGRTLKLYIDSVLLGTNVAAGPIAPYTAPPTVQTVGGLQNVGPNNPGGYCWNGSLKNLAWYTNTVLTPTQVLNHFNSGKGFPGDDTGARISRLLAYVPYDLVSTQTGNSQLTRTNVDGKNVVQAIQDANDTETGTLFERGDGYIVFKNRQSRVGAASVATFGEAWLPYEEDLTITQDPREIFTNVVVNQDAGITVSNVDTTAELDFFPRTLTIDSQDYTSDQAVYLSQYQLDRYKTARSRIPSLTIIPSANPLLWPQALGREIGDRITVTRNNPGAPAITEDFFIEKITHDVSVGQWKTSFMLSTATMYNYWILGDTVASVLGSTTKLGF